MEQLGSHRTDFHYIWYSRIFRKSVENIQVSLKWNKNKGYFTWRPIYIFITSRSFLLTMRNISDKRCRENHNTHFVISNFFFRKSWRFWEDEQYCTVGQATDDCMPHAHCMLDAQGYKRTLTICNTHWFATTGMVVLTRLSVTLYVHCLTCTGWFSR